MLHSDVHTSREEWKGVHYPAVVGHEIVGKVVGVGAKVSKFPVGSTVGVGCMVNSCRTCDACKEGDEQYCDHFVGTYNSKREAVHEPAGHTQGGYSSHIVVNQDFVLTIKAKQDQLAAVAPLLCAGITTYSPLKHWKAGPGKKVGVNGVGGLGHCAIKISHAMGAKTVAFTTSQKKVADGQKLGADAVVISTDAKEMETHKGTFDLILDTVSVSHNLDHFLSLLKKDGTLVLLGAPEHPHPSPSAQLMIFKRRALAGSLIGGIRETQEMLDFCAEKGIVSDIELIKPSYINEAYDRMVKGDVKYRFVIDNKAL